MEVAVEADHNVPAGAVEPCGESGLMAEVAGQPKELDPRIGGTQSGDGLGRPVGAAVVDEEELAVHAERGDGRREALMQRRDVFLLIV
ncbi:MAG: hypothetical protein M0D55_09825 [Elusimicrobiota bacterium]|nr:MAG: hypothetical protein M0D55_09825 [Elusimicrobiota bacterium]